MRNNNLTRYAYDIEVFPNFFSVVFIDVNVPVETIDAYCVADYKGLVDIKKQILADYIKPKIFIIDKQHNNDLGKLLKFMVDHKILIGYNSLGYDDVVLDCILAGHKAYNQGYRSAYGELTHFNEDLYKLSKRIIDSKDINPRYLFEELKRFRPPYYSIDLQELLYLKKSFTSLKQVAVQLKWYRLQDLPLDPDEDIDYGLTNEIIDYNINDVLITLALYRDSIDEIKLRENISRLYRVNGYSDSRSGLANRISKKLYSQRSGLFYSEFANERTYRHYIYYSDIISNNINFNTEQLQGFLSSLKRSGLQVGVTKFTESIIFNGKEYTFATGGLHSVDKPRIYEADDNTFIIDADVTSFYPTTILLEEIYPKHLDKTVFLSILKELTDNRVKSKGIAKKLTKYISENSDYVDDATQALLAEHTTISEALKIVINSIYGKLGDMNSFLNDLQAMYAVTINDQLFLIMLIEMLAEANIECISANTDGVVCIVPKDKLDDYYRICKEWEEKTKFSLEYIEYEKYVCYAVNDYMAIKTGYKDSIKPDKNQFIKTKGLFVPKVEINKGYRHPVVPLALIHHFADGIPIEDFIRNHQDIYDFCISIKTGPDFIKEYHTVKDGKLHIIPLQKNVRYYISNTNGSIIKRYRNPIIDKKGVKREIIKLHKGVNSTIFNNYIHYENFSYYKVNYGYYIKEAKKIALEITKGAVKKDGKLSYGGLFDF